ncbi:Arf GTPase arf3 [Neopestalotiopsis sp. 37M]|nr:Arf GTPase arf3 [Neopestalotiopsis sp. 37M]
MFPFPVQQTWRQTISFWLRDQLIRRGLRSSRTPVSRLFDTLPGTTPRRILVVGLDGVGKTELLRTCFSQDVTQPGGGDIKTFILTIGVSVEQVSCGNLTTYAYDIGGCMPGGLRRLARKMVAEADAVVWIVDSADRDRIVESREEFDRFLCSEGEEFGAVKPLLLLSNKSDLPQSMGLEEVKRHFENILPKMNSHVAETAMPTGDGLMEAFQWLSNQMQGKRSQEMKEKTTASTVTSQASEKS